MNTPHHCHCKTPCPVCHCKPKKTRNMHLLKKPLKDNLTGLLNRVDLLPDDRIKQAIHDSIVFVLIEVARIDQNGRGLL